MSIKQTRNKGTNKLYANGKLGKLNGDDCTDIRDRMTKLESAFEYMVRVYMCDEYSKEHADSVVESMIEKHIND